MLETTRTTTSPDPLAPSVGPPVLRPDLVRRPRIVDKLVGARAALALVVAPAGYGKTALLSDWARSDEREFLWLALDHCDGDDAIAEAVLDTFVSAGLVVPELLFEPRRPSSRDAAGLLRRLMRLVGC